MSDIVRRKLAHGEWCRGCGTGLPAGAEALTVTRRIGEQTALVVCLDCADDIVFLVVGEDNG